MSFAEDYAETAASESYTDSLAPLELGRSLLRARMVYAAVICVRRFAYAKLVRRPRSLSALYN